MTLQQLAVAAGGDVKWLLNSAALLRRAIRHTPAEARWWGLLRVLSESLGLSLKAAAEAATSSLRDGKTTPITDASGSASLRVDLNRYQSTFLANLSRALVLETPKRRGRPPRREKGGPVAAAERYGVDIGLVQAALARTPAERLELLESNAGMIRAMRSRGK
jgi:hypothetical protein